MQTERPYAGECLLSEAAGKRSRDSITIDESQTLKANQVLGGPVGHGTQTVTTTAHNGNAGNGSIGAPTADANVPPGKYRVELTSGGATGALVVFRPDDVKDGRGAVGSAYNGRVNFTLADGAADYVAGDGFDIVVSYASERYVMHDPEGTNGSQYAAGILYDAVTTAASEAAQAVMIARDAEVISARLQWDDQDTTEKAAALLALKAKGIIAR